MAARTGRATTKSESGNIKLAGERCMETLRHLSKVLSELHGDLSPVLLPEREDLPVREAIENSPKPFLSEVAMQINAIGAEIADEIIRIERIRARIDL
jgi:hypothetical protein